MHSSIPPCFLLSSIPADGFYAANIAVLLPFVKEKRKMNGDFSAGTEIPLLILILLNSLW